MEKDFLLEIGTEEVPFTFWPAVLESASRSIRDVLLKNRLRYRKAEVKSTPRRLALLVTGLADRQEARVVEITGPPRSRAWDASGRPTEALVKFCSRYQADPADVYWVMKEKGEYACLRKTEAGRKTEEVLAEALPAWLLGLPFPKSMRWGDLDVRFARPIRWILALYGQDVVRLQVGDITSSDWTLGHRFLGARGKLRVGSVAEYEARLEENRVILDPEDRRRRILARAQHLADEVGGEVVGDEDLVSQLVCLTEFPVPLLGAFDQAFLSLPEEVLIATMRDHQKYFAVRRKGQDGLLPYFIATANVESPDMGLIRKGNERVLKARLEDAKFFFEEDTRKPLEANVDRLRHVIYHKKLGSSYDKVLRIQRLAEFLAARILPEKIDIVRRAAWLCKADLVSQMVGEFPELQGTMGAIYAARSGEPAEVAVAIREHYAPASAEGDLPASMAGCLLSIADKIDTITGFFGIGTPVSGTSDPFGLRRRAIGILRILLDRRLELSLHELIWESLRVLNGLLVRELETVGAAVEDFVLSRLEQILLGRGLGHDTVAALLPRALENVPDTVRRAETLQAMRADPNFEDVLIACKRAVNILHQARKEYGYVGGNVSESPDAYEKEAEKGLLLSVLKSREKVALWMADRAYEKVLEELRSLKEPIDRFFDEVMVLVDDPPIRERRLALVSEIYKVFSRFADFTKVSL
mgnify:FL=1